jgi:predicted  nucleic acid-binding Zn-ribbon protein
MKKAIQITLLAQMALAAAVNVGAQPQKVNAATTTVNQQGQTELQKKLAQARIKQQKAEERLAAAKKQAAGLESKSAALIDKLSPTGEQAKIKEALQEVQKARAEVNQLSTELHELQSRQAHLWSEVNQLRDQMISKKGEIELAQDKLTQAHNDLLARPENSDLRRTYKDLKGEIDLRVDEIAEAKSKLARAEEKKAVYAKQEEKLKTQIKLLEEKITALEKKGAEEDKTGAVQEAQQELAGLKDQLEDLAKKQESNDGNIRAFKLRLRTTPDALARFKKKMAALQVDLDKVWQADEYACACQERYEAKQNEYQDLADQIAAHKQEAAKNESLLPSKQTAQEEAQKELTDKENAFTALADQVSQQDALIKEIKQVSADLKVARQEESLAAEAVQEATQTLAVLEKEQTEETEKEQEQDKEKDNDSEEAEKKDDPKKEDIEEKEEAEETDQTGDKEKTDEDSQITHIEIKSDLSVARREPAEKMCAIAFINKQCVLYDGKGQLTDQKLAGNTHWLVSARKKIAGQVFYLVGRDVWLKADDVVLENVKKGVARVLTAEARLVTGQGENTSRTLAKNTLWRVFAEKEIGGQKYYRLGSDQQWIQTSLVEFK